MKDRLIGLIHQANPWLKRPDFPIWNNHYIARFQTEKLLLSEWDELWLVLVGPRQAGKTTLAKYLSEVLIKRKRFEMLLYLNCDLLEVRQWLINPLFIKEAMDEFQLKKPIILIDEVQQLEMKSKVQEYLTGRHLEALILPLSYQEIGKVHESNLIYGCYPAVVKANEKAILLRQIYQDYITKDIIEILKVSKPDVMQKLITLIAHSAGQLVNYNQLGTDCSLSFTTVQNYLAILENTYTLARVTP